MFDEKRITQEEINSALQEVLEYCGIKTTINHKDNCFYITKIDSGIEWGSYKFDKSRKNVFHFICVRSNHAKIKLTPSPALMWLAKEMLTKEEYKQVLKKPHNNKIVSLLYKHIWQDLLDSGLSEDLLVIVYYNPKENCLDIQTDIENAYDATEWYKINSDGSFSTGDCSGEVHECPPSKTCLSVLNKARRIYNSKNFCQKLINHILNNGQFRFSNPEAYLLFDEFEQRYC